MRDEPKLLRAECAFVQHFFRRRRRGAQVDDSVVLQVAVPPESLSALFAHVRSVFLVLQQFVVHQFAATVENVPAICALKYFLVLR